MEDENNTLKTGYLLRFEPGGRWKLRWFTLLEEQLVCNHKRDRSLVIDIIPLQGASVVCQVPDPKFSQPGTFKISTATGEELYHQGAGKQDRDGWAHAIGAVIRSLTVAKQDSQHQIPFTTFRATANVSEILGALQDPDAGVHLGNHVRNGAVHKDCFTGSAVIDWLIRWSIIRKREDGAAMIQTLLKLGHVQEVDIKDGAAGVAMKFSDGDKLYRFSSLNLGTKKNSFYDSTDSDSSTSEDDDDEVQNEVKVKKGKIAKAAFLSKKKSIRKDWRMVKLILRENPSSLEYTRYICARDSACKVKVIDIGEVVFEGSKNECLACSQDPTESVRLKKRILIRDKKGKCYIFKTKDEQERLEWLPHLQALCLQSDSQLA